MNIKENVMSSEQRAALIDRACDHIEANEDQTINIDETVDSLLNTVARLKLQRTRAQLQAVVDKRLVKLKELRAQNAAAKIVFDEFAKLNQEVARLNDAVVSLEMVRG